ncbi:MAG: hypothetical protein QOI02_824, partial [Actinomycetota bacterium]|nr:hypothetical protein [Actinomycetota bacterium]
FFGWQWGKRLKPEDDARFHLTLLITIMGGAAITLSTFDPVKLTEYVIVLSAAALPLTYLPVLIVANDPEYMGTFVNGKVTNFFAQIFLVIILIASLAAIPLMIITGAGA